jgi:hypothetical protein
MRTHTEKRSAYGKSVAVSTNTLMSAAALLLMSACGGSGGSRQGTAADTVGGNGSGASDTDCRIVLREFAASTLQGGEAYVDSTGASFVVFRGVIDVDNALAGEAVSIWYQGQGYSPATVQASPCTTDCEQGLDYLNGGQSPPSGFTRYSFATQANTVEAGTDGVYTLQLIPYLTDGSGNQLYDHNRTAGNYTIVGNGSNYAVTDDFNVCPAPDPQGLDAPAGDGDGGDLNGG